MKKQAIIFDIDGTAIDSPEQKLPTERLEKAVRAVEGRYYVCAATGRAWSYAKPVLHGMRLTDPCIISGGTQICDPQTGQILWSCSIEPADLKAAAVILRDYPECQVLWNDYTEEDYLFGGLGLRPADINLDEQVYLLEVSFVPQSIAQEIIDKLSVIEGLICTLVVAQRPGLKDIHITNRSATKEHAIAELRNILNVSRADTIGVGDGHNDIHLFAGVHHKVAMANAVEELQSVADEIIGHVDKDGFAAYLESLASAR